MLDRNEKSCTFAPVKRQQKMFFDLGFGSSVWFRMPACHAGGREFEPRPNRSLEHSQKMRMLFLFIRVFLGKILQIIG